MFLNQGCVNNTDFAVMVYIAVKKLSLAEFYNTYNIFLNRCCISNRNVSVWICITASQAVQFATNRYFTLDRKSTRLNSSHRSQSRMPSSA